ncbi:hypothetical protein BDS110ZK17_23750 [Bradyrhizobium diazoefficiens]|nr:hypothetical protein XF16B_45520 [Bradyrhizobium diazoefficiens]BCF70205.1 hypothetical protein XF19B_45580 [Bradyrhizobium diazoefficiens]
MKHLRPFIRQRRHRHPCCKGEPAQRAIGAAFRFLMESHTWKHHPAPFSKSRRGRLRKAEQHFVIDSKRAFV